MDSSGLTNAEAANRRRRFGPNEPAPSEHRHRLSLLLAFVSNPLVVILLVAAIASAMLGDVVNGSIILGLVLFSVALDSIQSFRSQAAVKRLQGEVSVKAKVLRDGQWSEVSRRDLVPGDVIRLGAGDLVPADARLIEERDLHVQESALTGESLPVEKEVGTGTDEEWVFLGSAVVSGTATAEVEKTGAETRFGEIAARLRTRAPETEFERGLRRFGLLILRLVVLLVLAASLPMILRHRDPLQSLLFGVALAVGLTPEFLPMITTLTLAKGAVRMSKSKVIVKNLASIQNFGSMDILCSDKTGTLTTGEMQLVKRIDSHGQESVEAARLGLLNAAFQSGVATPLDAAILASLGNDTGEAKKVDEIPFDFERRRVSVVVDDSGRRLLICKGAPESIFDVCGDGQISDLAERLGSDGYRVLAVASKEVPIQDHYGPGDEAGLELVGFLAFADPPLPDALEVLHRLKGAGVQLKVISGDSEVVSRHVCQTVGLDPGRIVLGTDIDRMTDSALGAVAEQTTIFARVNPAQKNRIILALKNRGHVVGYMGDGINDAPALHTADIGISFAGATDVAKEAAQVVLGQRSLGLLHRGVLEGRMAFGNVMKYLLMESSSNFGNMFSMAGAAMFLDFLPMLPVQILLNNLLYDLAQITIPLDTVDPSMVHKPKRWDMRLVTAFMIWIGPISSIFDFLTFWFMLKVLHAHQSLFQTGWFVESIATQTLVIFVIRTRNEPWKSRPSRALAWSTAAIVAIAVLIPFTALGHTFGFVPLPGVFFAFLGVAVLTYLGLVEVAKRRLLRHIPA